MCIRLYIISCFVKMPIFDITRTNSEFHLHVFYILQRFTHALKIMPTAIQERNSQYFLHIDSSSGRLRNRKSSVTSQFDDFREISLSNSMTLMMTFQLYPTDVKFYFELACTSIYYIEYQIT